MTPTLKIEGTQELNDALHELEGAVAVKVVRDSLKTSLQPVLDDATAKVPVRRGRLKRSLGIGTRLTRRQKRVSERIVGTKGVEAYVGAGMVGGRYDGRHGHLVEFGTVHMGPQPFMRPAWAGNVSTVFSRLVAQMRANIDRAVKRAQRKALKAK